MLASVGLRHTGLSECRNLGAPFLMGSDLAGQSVVERPTGGTYVAGEVLALSVGWVENETERPELSGVGHEHFPIGWSLVTWVCTL